MGTSKIQPQEENNIPDKSVSVCMDLLRVGEGDDPLMGRRMRRPSMVQMISQTMGMDLLQVHEGDDFPSGQRMRRPSMVQMMQNVGDNIGQGIRLMPPVYLRSTSKAKRNWVKELKMTRMIFFVLFFLSMVSVRLVWWPAIAKQFQTFGEHFTQK